MRVRVLIVLGVLLTASLAAAQNEAATAAARALFHQGLDLADQEVWDEAADRFERALALRWAAPIAYNLADALSRVGRLVEATEHLRAILRREDASAEVRAAAEELLGALEPRLGALTVRAEGAAGAELRLDERPLAPAMLGVPIPVDPGTHVVRALRDGETVERATVEVAEGARAELNVVVPAPAPADPPPIPAASPAEVAAAGPVTTAPVTSVDGRRPRRRARLAIGLTAAAILAGGLAIVLAVTLGGGTPKLSGDFQPGRLEGEVLP